MATKKPTKAPAKLKTKPKPVDPVEPVEEVEAIAPEEIVDAEVELTVVEPESEPEPRPRKLDENIPGGRFLVNGVLVNANGEPLE